MTRKKSIFKKIILTLFIIILILIATVGIYLGYQLSRINRGETPLYDFGINFSSEDNVINKYKDSSSDIINIALFGVDSRHEKIGDVSHSDSTMILSIDKIHNKIKLSSILRDSYVDVKGKGKTKINEAYAYGGAALSVKTLNQNFNLNIEDYITVDFAGLTEIIDSLGGIEINIKENEISQINKYGKEIAQIMKSAYKPIQKKGIQLLNGHQATAYARIRKVGNGDFDRVERQKTVLIKLAKKIQDKGVTSYPAIMSSLIPYVETSATNTEILNIGTDCLLNNITDIDWYRFPLDGYCDALVKNNEWYLWIDKEKTTEHLHKFIYEDIKAVPLEPKF